jgi:23S rRNA pseudouridine2605 synthase
MNLRLNKAIAATGFCSRRRADELISAGRVRLNGELIKDFNVTVDLTQDRLSVDGKVLSARKNEYIVLHKPRGVVTTCYDEMGRESVLDILPTTYKHLKPVGRLDRDSEGLLILTNDGQFAQILTHPSNHVFKRYEVTVEGEISTSALKKMTRGMKLEDGFTLPAEVRLEIRNEDESIFEIGLREGRNRQIRRMCAQLGYPIIRLVRVAIGELQLRHMEPGDWRHLTQQEVDWFKSG